MKRILIVDDEKNTTLSAKDFLETTGLYQVFIENDGRRAVETAKAFVPDLILLDVMMPFLDGTEIAARLAKEPVCKTIPIVFLTSLLTPKEAAAQKGRIGGRSFIAKPITAADLIQCVKKELEKSHQ